MWDDYKTVYNINHTILKKRHISCNNDKSAWYSYFQEPLLFKTFDINVITNVQEMENWDGSHYNVGPNLSLQRAKLLQKMFGTDFWICLRYWWRKSLKEISRKSRKNK